MNNIFPLEEQVQQQGPRLSQNTVHDDLQIILNHTNIELENIISSRGDKASLTEALARPDFNCMPHIRDNTLLETWQKEKKALHYLLDLIEKNNLTFELFVHNLYLVEKEIENNPNQFKKYSVNVYPEDIEQPYFMETIKKFKYSNLLVIELTEKNKWTDVSINKLKYVQEKYGVEIAMDDIHPIPSAENMSMDSLQRFKEHGLRIDRHKMDGPFFQEMFHQYNISAIKDYNIFYLVMNHIINKYNMKKITIEWIETQKQYDFALKLESEFPEIEFRYQGFFFKNK